eukprot:1370251-Amorphochlora_amoeboformis.AAC.2
MSAEQAKLRVQNLLKKREDLENEIVSGRQGLRKLGVGMKEALVDKQGFPRADVDVHTIRILRNKIIRLQTDFQLVSTEIEEAMLGYHKHLKAAASTVQTTQSSTSEKRKTQLRKNVKKEILEEHERLMRGNPKMDRAAALQMAIESVKAARRKGGNGRTGVEGAERSGEEEKREENEEKKDLASLYGHLKPFLNVQKVWDGSPSKRAGLRADDLILKFGSVVQASQQGLKELVMHSRNTKVEVIVLR